MRWSRELAYALQFAQASATVDELRDRLFRRFRELDFDEATRIAEVALQAASAARRFMQAETLEEMISALQSAPRVEDAPLPEGSVFGKMLSPSFVWGQKQKYASVPSVQSRDDDAVTVTSFAQELLRAVVRLSRNWQPSEEGNDGQGQENLPGT